jgi:hypothetical protein
MQCKVNRKFRMLRRDIYKGEERESTATGSFMRMSRYLVSQANWIITSCLIMEYPLEPAYYYWSSVVEHPDKPGCGRGEYRGVICFGSTVEANCFMCLHLYMTVCTFVSLRLKRRE